MQLWMIQVETFRGSFCCHLGFCLVWGLVWFFVLFSEVKKLFPKFVFQKDAGSRNQCKEISKGTLERKAVNCHQEKKKKMNHDEKKTDLTNMVESHISYIPCLYTVEQELCYTYMRRLWSLTHIASNFCSSTDHCLKLTLLSFSKNVS